MSADNDGERTTSNERVVFDDEISDINGTQTAMKGPQESEHWQSLVHQESDKWVHTLQQLIDRFRADVVASKKCVTNDYGGETMAIWSCLSGYCEALATHKEASKRYSVFPIPMDAIVRLGTNEFRTTVLDRAEASLANDHSSSSQERHRARVRAVANAVWGTALSSSKKDEEHANSLYVCLRGSIDRKSIDCLGSSVTTVAGVKLLQQSFEAERTNNNQPKQSSGSAVVSTNKATSMLTLSEGENK